MVNDFWAKPGIGVSRVAPFGAIRAVAGVIVNAYANKLYRIVSSARQPWRHVAQDLPSFGMSESCPSKPLRRPARTRLARFYVASALSVAAILSPSNAHAVSVTMSYNPVLSGGGLIVLTDPTGALRIDITVGGGSISILGNEVRTSFFNATDQPRMNLNSNFLMSEVFFGNMDDIDDNGSRDSFAATVPGTWGNLSNTSFPGTDLDQFPLNAPPAGLSFAELIARGAQSPVLLNADESPVQNDFTASFFPTTPTNSFALLVDDTEGGNGILSRYFFGEIEVVIDPKIEATKTLSASGTSVGDTVSYTIVVENVGDFPVENISVIDNLEQADGTPISLASGPTFISNSAGSPEGSLAVGEISTYTASYTLTQDDIDAGGVCNSAEFSGLSAGDNISDVSDNGDDTDGNTTDDCTLLSSDRNPAWTLAKASSSTITEAGQIASYTFDLANTGNVSITAVSLTDMQCDATPMLSSGDTDSDSVLDVGETWIYTCDHTVTQAEVDAGAVNNTASATGTDPSGTLPAVNDSITITVEPLPDLALVKSDPVNEDEDASDSVSLGDTLTYTVTATNTGTITQTNVTVIDSMLSPSLRTCASVSPGNTCVLIGTYSVVQADVDTGQIVNTASVSSDTFPDPVRESVTTPVEQTGDLRLTKTDPVNADEDGTGNITIGDTLTYTITATNSGNVTQTNVVVTDTLITPSSRTCATVAPGATCVLTGTLTPSIPQVRAGEIVNTASVVSDDVTDPVSAAVTTPVGNESALTLVKSDPVNTDEDGSGSITLNDTLTYTVTATNSGWGIEEDVTVTDAKLTPDTQVCAIVLPGATCVLTGTYPVVQADVDRGQIVNTASATSNNITDPVGASVTTPVQQSPLLSVKKIVAEQVRVFPLVSDITFRVTMENTGDITLTGVQLEDDIATAMSPAVIVGMPAVTATGFGVDNGVNAAYDGATVLDTLGGNAVLGVGQTGTVDITVRLDFTNGYPGASNTAYGSADELTGPVASDFPIETPNDPSDTNPTPVLIIDSDGDGVPDGVESDTADRDGDGIPDQDDYDPTGYFFCEEDGTILSGGTITVINLTTGGRQEGIGQSNNITIVRDGSDGYFQFYVNRAGTYRLVPTYPSTGAVSTNRLPNSAPLDVTSLLPARPAVIGSGEFGATGTLADFSEAANGPFYLDFDIEAGDPSVFNNNLPLMHCGVPAVTASKEVVGDPVLQADGSSRVVYRVSATNTSATLVRDVRLVDDFATAFAGATVTPVSTAIVTAPPAFGATADAAFNGADRADLLTTGGDLAPGQAVTLDLTVDVFTATGGTFQNTVRAGGASPLTGASIDWDDASVLATFDAAPALLPLVVTKAADRSTIKIGEAMRYTVTITNPAQRMRNGLDIIDRLPPGFGYVPGTGTYEGVADEPLVSGRDLVWENRSLAPDETITLTLVARAGTATLGAETFINQAFVADRATGATISNVARAIVEFVPEPVFDCGEVIGKVFDDKDRDGYQDEGEPGLPGVRLATARGVLITTDAYGRYHVSCAMIPNAESGSNFLLKLDARTLPSGYRITTENPRVVRLTRGKITKLNFGASVNRVIRLDLTNAAFDANGTALDPQWAQGVEQLITLLGVEPSVLRLTYQLTGEDTDLAGERMRATSRLIADRWRERDGRYRLEIEQRMVSGQ